MRTTLLLALALVAALLVWFLGLRADAPAAIEPSRGVESAARVGALAPSGYDVVAPSSSEDREVETIGVEDAANPASRPTLVLVRVTAVETKEPVEHVRINAWGEKTLLVLGSQALETDEEGYVEMEVSPGFALLVNAQGDGVTTGNAQVRIEALQPGERRSVALAIVTRPDRVVHGIVLRRDTREAIPGVVVEPQSIRASGRASAVVTGNDGRFRVELRAFATAGLRYEHPEFGTALSSARTDHDRPENALEVLLDRPASIRAIVAPMRGTDTSSWILVATARAADLVQPSNAWDIPLAPLEWSAPLATRLEHLPPNARLSVEIHDGRRVAWRSSQAIVLAPDEERVLECPVGFGTLEGFVRAADGTPGRDVEIAIVPAVLEGQRRILEPQRFDVKTTCLDDGSYRFENIPLGAWYVLPAIDPQANPHQRRDSVALAERFEIVRDGDRVVHDIVLVSGLTIQGRVVDGSGKGLGLATVRGRHESIPGSVEFVAQNEGFFALGPLVPGTWTLEASAPGLSPVEGVQVVAGAQDIVLTLGAETRVVVDVRDERDAPVHGANVNIHGADGKGSAYSYTTDANGRVIHTGSTPISVHVSASTSDGRFAAMRDLAVSPGRDVHTTLRVEAGGRARLRFDGPGASATVIVLDRRLCVYMGIVVSGREIEITGPIGDVDLQLVVARERHDRVIALEREPKGVLVFDGGWK